MSWATISSIPWSARGADWTANLQEWNGTAASNTFKMDKPRLRRGQEDKETVAPIIESILRVRVKDTSRFLHNKLQSTDYENLRLLIQKGGNDWGSYILYKKDGGDQIVYDNPVLKLRFEGGLRRLKRPEWDLNGRETLLRTLAHILAETRAQLPVRVYTQWATSNTDLTNRGESQALQVPVSDLDGTQSAPSYYDALMNVLQAFNLQIIQYEGRWHVMQRLYRAQSMTWEERTMGGTESTGTFDPLITESQSQLKEWEDKYPEGMNRSAVSGLHRRFEYARQSFQNVAFTETYTDLSGNTRFVGWWDNGKWSFSSGNNPVISASDGQSTSDPGFIEQPLDHVFERPATGDPDEVEILRIQVDITTRTPASGGGGTINVGILEFIARQKHDTTLQNQYWNPVVGWQTGETYIEAEDIPIPTGGGTQTTSKDIITIPPINPPSASIDRWECIVRCICDDDPDNDTENEVVSIEFKQVSVEMKKSASSVSGEGFYAGSQDADRTINVTIGGWDRDNQAAGMVRYWNGSEWRKSNNFEYEPGSPARQLGRAATDGLEHQLNHDLAEVQGAVSPDGASIIDSPEIGGVRYIPSHTDEILTHERRYMEFIEHKNQ